MCTPTVYFQAQVLSTVQSKGYLLELSLGVAR